MPRLNKFWDLGLWLITAVLIALVDYLTKQLALSELQQYKPVRLFAWFNFTLAFNTGAAFSFLDQAGGWQRWLFTGIALLVSIAIVIWLARLPRAALRTKFALALILGGAIGNLHDRLTLGYVIDFIDWHIGTWHWPIFNLADSAITVGVLLALLPDSGEK